MRQSYLIKYVEVILVIKSKTSFIREHKCWIQLIENIWVLFDDTIDREERRTRVKEN